MDLREAREIAARIQIDRRLHDRATDDPPTQSGTAIIILDDRITELEAQISNDTDYREQKKGYISMMAERNAYYADLEKAIIRIQELDAQRDELVEAAIKFCTWWYANPRIHDVPIPIHQAIFRAVAKVTDKP